MITIEPFRCQGNCEANASKSYLQRALVIAMLAERQSTLLRCGESDDVEAVADVVRRLGAKVSGVETLNISPAELNLEKDIEINVGESGLALRMLAPVVSLFSRTVTIQGEGSLTGRPLQPLLDVLSIAGISYECREGTLPLKICSAPVSKVIQIDASFSSQMLTGLLIALPLVDFDTEIHVSGAVSKPYIDMTLDIIRDFGASVEVENYQKFTIPGKQKFKGTTYEIEGDWSGAANFLVAAAVSGDILVEGLVRNSKQADRAVIDVLKMFGAAVSFNESGVSVKKKECHPFSVDVTDCPDLFPILSILAAAARGTSVIDGIARLEYKESNRVEAVREMMKALGGNIHISGDRMMIYGKGKLKGGTVDSFNDHRIAMAAAVGACISEEPVNILQPQSVNKSFPEFFDKLKRLT